MAIVHQDDIDFLKLLTVHIPTSARERFENLIRMIQKTVTHCDMMQRANDRLRNTLAEEASPEARREQFEIERIKRREEMLAPDDPEEG